MWDADGREYLDAIAGEWVVNAGFRNSESADVAIYWPAHAEWHGGAIARRGPA